MFVMHIGMRARIEIWANGKVHLVLGTALATIYGDYTWAVDNIVSEMLQ